MERRRARALTTAALALLGAGCLGELDHDLATDEPAAPARAADAVPAEAQGEAAAAPGRHDGPQEPDVEPRVPAHPGPPAMRSSGCGAPAPATGLRRIRANGKDREYLLRLPAGYDPLRPLPLVFIFHGATSDGAHFEAKRADLGAAMGPHAVLVYPTALVDPGRGWTTWTRDREDDAVFFDTLLAEVTGEACVDLDRVFATGFSAGGSFAAWLGCKRGDRLRAIAPIAGGTGDFRSCSGSVAVFMGCGSRDDALRSVVSTRDAYARRNGCRDAALIPLERPGCVAFADCRPGAPVEFCEYPLGHVWPSWMGAAIWTFFSRL